MDQSWGKKKGLGGEEIQERPTLRGGAIGRQRGGGESERGFQEERESGLEKKRPLEKMLKVNRIGQLQCMQDGCGSSEAEKLGSPRNKGLRIGGGATVSFWEETKRVPSIIIKV